MLWPLAIVFVGIIAVLAGATGLGIALDHRK